MELVQLTGLIQGVVGDFPEIHLVYLFGSQATGTADERSDVDLAILCERENDQEIRARFQHAVCLALRTDRVDVVLLNRAPIELAYNVIAARCLVFSTSRALQIEYESDVLSRYGDYLPVLRMFREQISQGGQHGKRVQRYRKALERTQRAIAEAHAATDEDEK